MLTERLIRDTPPSGKDRILWDAQIKGLGVRIRTSGTKTYILNYRVSGREHRVTLARVGEMALREARGRRAGSHPGGRGRPVDAAARSARGADGERGSGAVFHRVCASAGRGGAPGSRHGGRLPSASGALSAACALGASDCGHHARRHRAHGGAAGGGRTGAAEPCAGVHEPGVPVVRGLGLRAQHTNPVRGIERSREEARDRVLAPSELAALGEALGRAESDKPAAVAAIRVAALTGLRIGEVLAMRWDHVDVERSAVVLPQTKTGRRLHGLPTAALELLARLPRINGYVFTSGHGAEWDVPASYMSVRAAFSAHRGGCGPGGCAAARPAQDGDDERGAGGARVARAAGPARAQDGGDGGPLHPACGRGGARGAGAYRRGHRGAASRRGAR